MFGVQIVEKSNISVLFIKHVSLMVKQYFSKVFLWVQFLYMLYSFIKRIYIYESKENWPSGLRW
jgi:hypothetical protein